MKAVILAGGLGSRLAEETTVRPKPMVEIGGRPILWHILKIYSSHGINDFIICLGYKGYMIKEYFANYFLHMSDVTFDMSNNSMEVHQRQVEPWRVTLVDTGEGSATGGRMKRVRNYIGNETFLLTYGDGVSDVSITDTIKFHEDHKRLATITAARSPARFGALDLQGDTVINFREKPRGEAWVNAGFFVLEPQVLDYVTGDETTWENEPLWQLSRDRQLSAYIHDGFWQPMDTIRDKVILESLWASGKAPWKSWQ